MCAIRPVAAAQRPDQPHNLPAALEAGGIHRSGYEQGQEWIACDEYVATRAEHGEQCLAPAFEEGADGLSVGGIEHGEARAGFAIGAVERRRNAPHAARAGAHLLLLDGVVFPQPVWRVGDDGVDGVMRGCAEPVDAVGHVEMLPTKDMEGGRAGILAHRVSVSHSQVQQQARASSSYATWWRLRG